MPKLIQDNQHLPRNTTRLITQPEHIASLRQESHPVDHYLVAHTVWHEALHALEQGNSPSKSQHTIGLWLPGNTELEALSDTHKNWPLIAIDFPVFTDGRGYSLARLLREQGYHGTLGAYGDILVDQMYYLKRCGFNAFWLRDDQSSQAALDALSDFSAHYQAAADEGLPIHRFY